MSIRKYYYGSPLESTDSLKQWFFVLAGFIALFVAIPGRSGAQGNLLVTPRRVVFENASRIQELNLANIGTDSARYLISIVEIKMNEDGTFERITEADSGQLFASKYLRVYPRSVIVPPGESQVVKVQVVKADGLTPGEYRSHLYLRAVPFEKPLGDSTVQTDSSQISVKLTPIFGISIPAIIRVGENNTKITLSNAELEFPTGADPRLGITLNRSGLMSSYGDISVEYVSASGKVKEVGSVKGIAVYTPNIKRRFFVNLNEAQGADLHNGTLRIVYKTQKEARIQDSSNIELSLK